MDDAGLRTAAFNWLREQVDRQGEVLSRESLVRGFEYLGERVHVISAQGIFKPRQLVLPLSITHAPRGPYDEGIDYGGTLRYRYRGTDPYHPDNAGLRETMRRRDPLIYFHGIVPGRYLAHWPVYVVGDDPDDLTFRVDLQESLVESVSYDEAMEIKRGYAEVVVRRRLHQHTFRERVLRAYREQCAVCRLRHDKLLDAAHIIPDSHPEGEPRVSNGLALCKLHHAAFDAFFFGIRPDYRIEVRRSVLEEEDGPMLQHGLKGIHGVVLHSPSRLADRPDPVLLARQYKKFRGAFQ